MQDRPAEKRTLPPDIQQEALHILRSHFGHDVEITAADIFSSPTRRNVLARIELKSSSAEVPKSVIFKQSLPRKEDPDFTEANDRFSRDWAGLKFANEVGEKSHNVPQFFGGSKENRFILIEDLGAHRSLVDSLLVPGNIDGAIPALKRYVSALGKFHASGFGRTGEYLEILNDINKDAKSPQTELTFHSDMILDGLKKSNSLLGTSVTPSCQEEIVQVLDALFKPGPFTVLIHGDIAPDNVFDHEEPKGLQLIDFEIASVRNALLDGTYLRMCMPTGWCAKALPDNVINTLENIYRREIAEHIVDARDDIKYGTAYTQACAFWVLIEMAHLHNKFKEDNSWGGLPPGTPEHLMWDADNNSGRSRFLTRLHAFIEVANDHNMLPNIKEMAISMLAAIKEQKLWLDAKPLDFYPAFHERPVLANKSRTSSDEDITVTKSPGSLAGNKQGKQPPQAKDGPTTSNTQNTTRGAMQSRYNALQNKVAPTKPQAAEKVLAMKPAETVSSPTDKLKNPFSTKLKKD